MSTPAQRAAFRLATSLPSRTHHWQPVVGQWGIRRSTAEIQQLTAQLRDAEAAGMSRQNMRRAFKVSNHTIYEILGPAK